MANVDSFDRERDLTFARQALGSIETHWRMMERRAGKDEEVALTAFLSDGGQYSIIEVGYEPPLFLSLTVKPTNPDDLESLTTILVPYVNVRFLFEIVKVASGRQRRKVGFRGGEGVSS